MQSERFINAALYWCGLGHPDPMTNREKMLRTFFMKAVYDLPMTKVLIENLETNPSLRWLCGWEYKGHVPSKATFSRAFKEFAEQKLLDAHACSRCIGKLQGESIRACQYGLTAIAGRKKSCRKNMPKKGLKAKKKHGRKSKAELTAMTKNGLGEIKARRLELCRTTAKLKFH